MSRQNKWDELFEEASQEVLRWRQKHKRATLTEIEETVDSELARMRAQMIQDLAMASETADIGALPKAERPPCPHCGRPLVANGKQKRVLATDYEQGVTLQRSKGYCQHCKLSFFPSG
jgi:RNase P subunit RPR2